MKYFIFQIKLHHGIKYLYILVYHIEFELCEKIVSKCNGYKDLYEPTLQFNISSLKHYKILSNHFPITNDPYRYLNHQRHTNP